jgi:predicted Rossmann fold flavoprotein
MLKYDLIIVGGGPAGMMAGFIASQNKNNKILIIDRNKSFGRKLSLTGKGRCNITHNENDFKKMIQYYNSEGGKFLFSGFSKFGVKETLSFFKRNGLDLKVERGNRYFPKEGDSQSVIDFFEKNLKKNNIDIFYSSKVTKFNIKNKKIINIELSDDRTISATNYIIASGGKSYPITGSDGLIFDLLKKAGHNIADLTPALVPLKCKEEWIKKLSGLSLKNVSLKIKGSKKSIFGEMLFTHFGISGPIVLNISNTVVNMIGDRDVKLYLDLKPALSLKSLDLRLQRDFNKYANHDFKNSLNDLLPQSLIKEIIKLSGISFHKKVHQVTKEERIKLAKTIKNIEITINGHLGFETAIVTSGGINLKEVDQKNMKSKILDNVYFCGEVLNIDGKTGGYNLQMCWTTGFIAGSNFTNNVDKK